MNGHKTDYPTPAYTKAILVRPVEIGTTKTAEIRQALCTNGLVTPEDVVVYEDRSLNNVNRVDIEAVGRLDAQCKASVERWAGFADARSEKSKNLSFANVRMGAHAVHVKPGTDPDGGLETLKSVMNNMQGSAEITCANGAVFSGMRASVKVQQDPSSGELDINAMLGDLPVAMSTLCNRIMDKDTPKR